MAITAESLTEMINDAQRAYDEVEAELLELSVRAAELEDRQRSLKTERDAFIASFLRRFPGNPAPLESGSQSRFYSLDAAPEDWSSLPRSEVVELAVKELTEQNGFATPAEIEALLKSKRRTDDSRDAIGASLAYLNRSDRVYRRARAEWVYGREA